MAKQTLKSIGTSNGMDAADTRKAWDEARKPHKRNATEHTGQSIAELFTIVLAWLSDVGERFSFTERDELVELASQAIGNPFNRSMIRVITALYFCGYKSAERIGALVAEYTVEIGTKALLLVNARDLVGKLFVSRTISAEVMRDVFSKLSGMLTGESQVESKNHAYRVSIKAVLTGSGYEFPEGHYLLDSQLSEIVDYVKDAKYASIRQIALIARAFNLAELRADEERARNEEHDRIVRESLAQLETETPEVETPEIPQAETPETPEVETGKGKRSRKVA